MSDGEWRHMHGNYENGRFRLWVDGAPIRYQVCRALVLAGKLYLLVSILVSAGLAILAVSHTEVNPIGAFFAGLFFTFLCAFTALALWGFYEWLREKWCLR